jgi:hypothetical protein
MNERLSSDLARIRIEAEAGYLWDRWNDGVDAGLKSRGRVSRGSLFNMQATHRDARTLFADVSADWSADQSGWSRLTADEARGVREALDGFPHLARRCDDQLTAVTARVSEGRRVRVAALRDLSTSFDDLLELIVRLASARRDPPQDESAVTPVAG